MSQASIVSSGDGLFRLEGVLDFSAVPALLEDSSALFCGHANVTVDLSGVTQVNSAGLGLLLEWIDLAQSANQNLRLQQLPNAMLEIAKVSGVSELLADVVQ